jgi:diguanylate cyclase (GGDEF)-like protein
MVVEANFEFAERIRRLLRRSAPVEFAITHAVSLNESLMILEENSFDAILLDLFLPDSRGIDSLLHLVTRADGMPIVTITERADPVLAIRSIREGAQDHLVRSELNTRRLAQSISYAIERQRIRAVLHQQSHHDDLTDLLNRRGFTSQAQRQLKLAQRTGWELLLFFLDLDQLKAINTEFGHLEGDHALIAIAGILKNTFRSSDIIARIGGDEFVVLALDAPGAGIDVITSRLKKHLAEYNKKNTGYSLSLAFGVARFDPNDHISIQTLIAEADESLYTKKGKT